MDTLITKIKETENWLIEHPDADWMARHDMIAKLANLKKRQQIVEEYDNKHEADNIND